MSHYEIRANWDAEAQVWVASSDDVPGLVTEAESFEALVEKVLVMVPELLELNHVPLRDHGQNIEIKATRSATLKCAAA